MITSLTFHRLSTQQRRTLVDHVASERPIPFLARNGNPSQSKLLSLKLLRWADNGHRTTMLTTDGREVACRILAEYAEALIRTGAGRAPLEDLLEQNMPSERVEELKKILNQPQEQFEASPQPIENNTPLDYAADRPR